MKMTDNGEKKGGSFYSPYEQKIKSKRNWKKGR